MKYIKILTAVFLTASVLAGCADIPETESQQSLVIYTKSPEESQTESITESMTEEVKELQVEPPTEEFTEPETESPTDLIIEQITEPETFADYDDNSYVEYHFRNKKLLNQHFQKHGGEFADDFGYQSAEEYEKGASDVINNTSALYKTEAEDGDGIYYIESTNEFVVLSTDGYIRTYFRPDKGIDYFNRQ